MRLQEMYYLIRNTVINWVEPDISEVDSPETGNTVFLCRNPKSVICELEPLRIIQSVSESIDIICSCFPVLAVKGATYLSPQDKDKFISQVRKVHNNIIAMMDMCETLGVCENSNGFDVKLPADITLEGISECAHDLNVIFSQCPILRQDNCEIKLKGVDVGSAWLVFTIIGATAGATLILNNLASLIDKVIILRSHWLSYKQQEEHLRSLKIANDAIEAVVDTFKNAITIEQEQIVNELAVKMA